MELNLSFLKLTDHKSFSDENDVDPEAGLNNDYKPKTEYYPENQFNNLNLNLDGSKTI